MKLHTKVRHATPLLTMHKISLHILITIHLNQRNLNVEVTNCASFCPQRKLHSYLMEKTPESVNAEDKEPSL